MHQLLVSIALLVGPCSLDQAVVTYVPPSSAHVLAISDCGGVRCFERWVETDGKRLGYARVCTGENGKFEAAPLP